MSETEVNLTLKSFDSLKAWSGISWLNLLWLDLLGLHLLLSILRLYHLRLLWVIHLLLLGLGHVLLLGLHDELLLLLLLRLSVHTSLLLAIIEVLLRDRLVAFRHFGPIKIPVTEATAAAHHDHDDKHCGDQVCVSPVGAVRTQKVISILEGIVVENGARIVLRCSLTLSGK